MEPSEYDTIARLESQHWWYVGMRYIAERVLGGIRLPTNARLLDAGCGTGGGLKWLAAYGTVTGIDLHPLAICYASQVSHRLARASIQALPFPDNTFDLVASFEVLYHLAVTDDVKALCEFARVLRPGSWLLVRVPAHDWLRGAHDRQVHTRHRYAKSELRRKLQTAGLDVKRLTGVSPLFVPVAALRRLTQRGGAAHSDVTLPPPVINRALTAALSAEGLWLRHFDLPTGLSLLALAHKPDNSNSNSQL